MVHKGMLLKTFSNNDNKLQINVIGRSAIVA